VPAVSEKTETIVATLLFLMTRYTIEADPSVGKAILHHLDLLENHQDTSDPSITNTCRRLKNHWSGVLSVKSNINRNKISPSNVDTHIH
jgi:hypothetical protein